MDASPLLADSCRGFWTPVQLLVYFHSIFIHNALQSADGAAVTNAADRFNRANEGDDDELADGVDSQHTDYSYTNIADCDAVLSAVSYTANISLISAVLLLLWLIVLSHC